MKEQIRIIGLALAIFCAGAFLCFASFAAHASVAIYPPSAAYEEAIADAFTDAVWDAQVCMYGHVRAQLNRGERDTDKIITAAVNQCGKGVRNVVMNLMKRPDLARKVETYLRMLAAEQLSKVPGLRLK